MKGGGRKRERKEEGRRSENTCRLFTRQLSYIKLQIEVPRRTGLCTDTIQIVRNCSNQIELPWPFTGHVH